MKLTKTQTEALAELGLKTLLNELTQKVTNGKVHPVAKRAKGGQKGRKWTREQHAKFARTMRKVWEAKKASK